jgi:hypothetical protein
VQPGTFDEALEQKLVRNFPTAADYRTKPTTADNNSHKHSPRDDDDSDDDGDHSRLTHSPTGNAARSNDNLDDNNSWVSDNGLDDSRHSRHSKKTVEIKQSENSQRNDTNTNVDIDTKPMAVLSFSAKSTNKISKVMQRFPTTILDGIKKTTTTKTTKTTKNRQVHRIDPLSKSYNYDGLGLPGTYHLQQAEKNDLNNIYGVKNMIKNAERKDFQPLVSLSSKFIGKVDDNSNNSMKSINYAEVTHNPYQKKIKHPPTLSTNESHSRS